MGQCTSNTNQTKSYGLHYAAIIGDVRKLKRAIAKGNANPKKFNINKLKKSSCFNKNQNINTADTALHFAAKYGHEEIVQILLNNGADSEILNAQQQTPLDLSRM